MIKTITTGRDRINKANMKTTLETTSNSLSLEETLSNNKIQLKKETFPGRIHKDSLDLTMLWEADKLYDKATFEAKGKDSELIRDLRRFRKLKDIPKTKIKMLEVEIISSNITKTTNNSQVLELVDSHCNRESVEEAIQFNNKDRRDPWVNNKTNLLHNLLQFLRIIPCLLRLKWRNCKLRLSFTD